jgi:formate dehydrogenase beta subunit
MLPLTILADHLAGGGEPNGLDGRIGELERVMRRTSICGLGQVALGPVASVLRLTGSSDQG